MIIKTHKDIKRKSQTNIHHELDTKNLNKIISKSNLTIQTGRIYSRNEKLVQHKKKKKSMQPNRF